MKLLLVDDEKLALMQLERMVRSIINDNYGTDDHVEIYSYQIISEAIAFAQEQVPDVIFLDINMPEMNGLDAAEILLEANPNLSIIFVTAYDDFAIQAFELNAVDYLLKPLSLPRLKKTIERLYSKQERKTVSNLYVQQEIAQKIYAMKKIRFQVGKTIIDYPKWKTAKAQELFAYLLHYRGQFVPKYKIINMFSPELDKKRAMTQLYTVIYQIRRCLKESNIEVKIDNDSIQEGYCMRLENTWLDFEQWENEINGLDINDPLFFDKLEQVLLLYEGDYMEDYDYLWAESERERLRQIWLQHAKILLKHFYEEEQWLKVLQLSDALSGLGMYEFDNGVYILEAYQQLGQYDKLKQYYERQQQFMREEFDLPVPVELSAWYEEWLGSRKS